MKHCDNCTHRRETGIDRIDCANTAATPHTDSYPGSGAHPVRFDPEIVVGCDGWDLDVMAEWGMAAVPALVQIQGGAR